MENKGKIAFRTCFSSISFYGYKLDILKSGVQKYLRRRIFNKMIWCVAEIYLFQMLKETDKDKRAAKGIITNLINRLIIMLDEEMLFCECDRYLLIRKYMEEFEICDRDNFVCLYKICKLLIQSKMIRRNSDINGYFRHGMNVWGIEKPKDIYCKGDKIDDNFWFENFKRYFENGDCNCFYYMYKILDGKRNGIKKRFGRKDNIYMIWEYLFSRKNIIENIILKENLKYRLKEFHNKKRKERHIFLSAAVDIALHCGLNDNNGDYELFKKKKKIFDKKFNDKDKILCEIFNNREKMSMDDYVIDMHCSLGRKLGKNKIDFIKSGAVVIYEDKEFYVDEWRRCYNMGKKNTVKDKSKKKEKTNKEKLRNDKSKRIKKIRGIPSFNDLENELEFIDGDHFAKERIKICMNNTCGNKVMCFEYDNFIWKEGRKTMNYNRDYICFDECKELFGLEKIGMIRILTDFRLCKINKAEKSWVDNWEKVKIKEGEERVVYCKMRKIGNGEEIIKRKNEIKKNKEILKELVKIAIVRGIFRVSDFNLKNILVNGDKMVSIDEGDIGKRVGIIGGRNKWIIEELNKDKTIINNIFEILSTVIYLKKKLIETTMREYKFCDELIEEVFKNFKNLKKDLMKEGIKF